MSHDFYLSREQVRELDRRAIHGFGVPGVVLMENAGRGAAELLMRLNPEKRLAVILCGPGNNGGDGFVMARHLDNAGWPVDVRYFGKPVEKRESTILMGLWHPTGLPPDADSNYRIVARSGIDRLPLHDAAHFQSALLTEEIVCRECWVVDAMFGTGLTRPLSSPSDEVAAIINASRNPVLAVDIPSGLDCDTGEPLGPTVRATHTATFVAAKLGFRNPASRAWTGEVHVIDIGAPRKLVDEYRHQARGRDET